MSVAFISAPTLEQVLVDGLDNLMAGKVELKPQSQVPLETAERLPTCLFLTLPISDSVAAAVTLLLLLKKNRRPARFLNPDLTGLMAFFPELFNKLYVIVMNTRPPSGFLLKCGALDPSISRDLLSGD